MSEYIEFGKLNSYAKLGKKVWPRRGEKMPPPMPMPLATAAAAKSAIGEPLADAGWQEADEFVADVACK
jgi:hypothetical protein